MDLDFFDSVIAQASCHSKEIACHVVGDPLTQANLSQYLDIIHKYNCKALLTTSGYFLKKHSYETLFHPCVKQINISLNAFNKNDTSLSFEQYIEPILNLAKEKIKRKKELFINFRIWNLDEMMSEKAFNQRLFHTFSEAFSLPLSLEDIYHNKAKSIRLAYKVLLHFDNYFQWPSLENKVYGDGKCQGLQSHIAILASGKVVPCCLDCDGVIELGDLHKQSLEDIISSPRATKMIKGFKEGKATEELCQKCSYKERFAIQ